MKRLIRRFLVFFMLVNFSTYANAQENFKPHKKLLKKEVWSKVSPIRFEDQYNYFAVEWTENEYILMDMGAQNKVLMRADNFSIIEKKIKSERKNRFIPHLKLAQKMLWERVSMYSFECAYLRLAVEWQEKEYVLLEMDGEKKELTRSKDFKDIQLVITKLTLI